MKGRVGMATCFGQIFRDEAVDVALGEVGICLTGSSEASKSLCFCGSCGDYLIFDQNDIDFKSGKHGFCCGNTGTGIHCEEWKENYRFWECFLWQVLYMRKL